MRQQGHTEFSLKNILRSQGTQETLKQLATVGRIALTVCDEKARPLLAVSDNGAGIRTDGTSIPAGDATQFKQDILYQDQRAGEIRGRMHHPADPDKARMTLELAAEWIRDKIESEVNQNSLSAEILNNYEELNLLYEFSEEIITVFDTREICEIVLRKALSVIGADKASILLWDSQKKRLSMMASVGLPDSQTKDLHLEPDEGICGYVFKTGKALLVEDMANLPTELSPGKGTYKTESFLSVPLLVSPMKVKGKIIGVINLADKPGRRSYHAADLKLLSAISSQATLSILNSSLIQEAKENERIQKEMEIAEAVQKNLLPRRAPEIPGIELVGRCVPAKEVGGDYYDFFPKQNGGVGFLVADVSGHSISSGIMMAITRGLLQSESVHEKSPGKLLSDINRSLFADLVSSELFITMCYFSYDPKHRKLGFANGGHNPTILIRAGSDDAELLDAEGMGIGFMDDVEFEERETALAPGDLLVLYTDGIVEAENEHRDQFGMDRFLTHLKNLRERSAEEILEGLYRAVLAHMGGADPQAKQQDDITLLILKVL